MLNMGIGEDECGLGRGSRTAESRGMTDNSQHRRALGYIGQLCSVWMGLLETRIPAVRNHWSHPRSHLISWLLQMSLDVLF